VVVATRRAARYPLPVTTPGARRSFPCAGRRELTEAIYSTLRANDMTDGVHVRLMVTRGVKRTPYQDPRVTIGPATVVIIAEHEEPLPATVTDGITLFTTHVRRAAAGRARPQAQRALQAQRHHRLPPGLYRWRWGGADPRPARIRGRGMRHTSSSSSASNGVWAPHRYDAVWSSTGFEPWRPRETTLSDHDAAVAEACRPFHAALHARRVRI
jgi:hypothetical protein